MTRTHTIPNQMYPICSLKKKKKLNTRGCKDNFFVYISTTTNGARRQKKNTTENRQIHQSLLTLEMCLFRVLGVRCVRHNGQRLNEIRIKDDLNIERVFRQTNAVRVSVLSTYIAHFGFCVSSFSKIIASEFNTHTHTTHMHTLVLTCIRQSL